MREVRHTIIRIIGNRLNKANHTRWQGKDFDFTGVVFDGGDLRSAEFSGGFVSFLDAEFADGVVDFTDAAFNGAMVVFTDARFTGGTADFFGADFNGSIVSFNNAKFTAGVVLFSAASFIKGRVDFNAEFTGSYVLFEGARFTEGVVGFTGLRASSDGRQAPHASFTKGRVDFTEATGSVPEGLKTAAAQGKRGVVVPSKRWAARKDGKSGEGSPDAEQVHRGRP